MINRVKDYITEYGVEDDGFADFIEKNIKNDKTIEVNFFNYVSFLSFLRILLRCRSKLPEDMNSARIY